MSKDRKSRRRVVAKAKRATRKKRLWSMTSKTTGLKATSRQAERAARAADWIKGDLPVTELMIPTRPPAKIKIGERHRKDLGNIAALARDINERGLLHPVVIDRHNRLIAGERRLAAWQHPDCIFREQEIPVRVVPLQDIVAGEWAENDPALRKDFTHSEAVAIKRAIEAELKPAAKARQAHGQTAPGRKAAKGGKGDGIKSGDRAAAFTGKSRRTIEKAEAIVDAAEAEPEKYGKLKKDMDRSGRVDGPFKRLKTMKAAEQIRKEPPPLPGNGPYRGVVIDFPWAAEPENGGPDRLARGYYPYPTMSLAEIAEYAREKIRPILHADCFGALWITNYHLALGHQVPIFEALDATAVTIRTWVKDRMGRGQTFRGQTEHAVIFRCGKPTLVVDNLTTFFHAAVDKKQHSRKPQKFYDDFERLVAAPRYATLFETVDRGAKWDGHGDKIEAGKNRGELRLEAAE